MIADNVNLIVYHAGCPDGWCSAFIAKKRFPDAELMPRNHGEPLPDLTGKRVLVCDFSWRTREDNEKLAAQAETFHILDHHKTAVEALDGLPFSTFDMSRSGAGITWDTLYPGQPRPWFVNYVEDRDLWNWALPDSYRVSGYLMTLPHTLDAWAQLELMTEVEAAKLGNGALNQVLYYCEQVGNHALKANIHGYPAMLVNAPYVSISDLCNQLLIKHPEIKVAAGWFLRGDGLIQYSFRSRREDDVDVSKIAQYFGGGGHKNAAGAQESMYDGLATVREWLDV